ncbi:uncharacterized protein LOC143630518 [Bidens hawaiensis]|uniref:uncharacterized protein LOC143630518 n=1 Tax=Bidens hawaiensis TaxID=980011 RepID=UPI00404960AC
MAWRAKRNRLPTKLELAKRNVDIPNKMCALSESCEESADHIFSACFVATSVWEGIERWCGLETIYAFEVRYLMEVFNFATGGKMGKRIVHGVIVVVWCIKKARDDSIFNGKKANIGKIVASVKSLLFLWLKSRSRFKKIVWKNWCKSSLYML